VEARCGRWNELLISAAEKTEAYRSRPVPSPGKEAAAAVPIDQPAVPISIVISRKRIPGEMAPVQREIRPFVISTMKREFPMTWQAQVHAMNWKADAVSEVAVEFLALIWGTMQ
jgi:hypothetical protein